MNASPSQIVPRTDAAWLAEHTATLDNHYCYTACPVCGSDAVGYRWRERDHTSEYAGRSYACGWRAWLPDVSNEIEDAMYALTDGQAAA